MPFVHVRVTPAIALDQRRQIVEDITASLVRILDKDPRMTHIVIDEVPPDNWGFDGRLTSD
jgi:4-oxalocrotonate tautomerase